MLTVSETKPHRSELTGLTKTDEILLVLAGHSHLTANNSYSVKRKNLLLLSPTPHLQQQRSLYFIASKRKSFKTFAHCLAHCLCMVCIISLLLKFNGFYVTATSSIEGNLFFPPCFQISLTVSFMAVYLNAVLCQIQPPFFFTDKSSSSI